MNLAGRGVILTTDARDLLTRLAGKMDAVFGPTPVARHEQDYALAVEYGYYLYLEKPPVLNPEAFCRMLQLEERAVRPTVVWFQALADPRRLALRERIVAGEFGRLLSVAFSGFWPREQAYHTSSRWVGCLKRDGELILDSVFGNAMAHFLNNLLFCCGTGDLWSWGEVKHPEAELYRAHPIESPDTAFVSGETRGGVDLRFCGSHACANIWKHQETLHAEHTSLVFPASGDVVILCPDGKRKVVPYVGGGAFEELSMLRFLLSLASPEQRGGMTIREALPFVDFHQPAQQKKGLPASQKSPITAPSARPAEF